VTNKDIQTQLGHSTIRVTMDLYTHINDNEKDQVKNWLQEGIGKLLTSTQAPTIPPKTHTL
jgi:integrase